VLTLVGCHAMRVVRGIREPGAGVWALPPKSQMALFVCRMFLMGFLAFLAGPGFLSRFLVPVYVAAVAALFTYSDLYPQRFVAGLTAPGAATAPDGGEDVRPAGRRVPGPRLPP